MSTLRDRLKLPVGDDGALAARLLMPLTLVHLENADTIEAGQVAGDLAASLRGCTLVISARLRGLGADAGWREVVVSPFDSATALDQLRAELGDAAPGQKSWPALAEALGCLPLALHLAAGYLRTDHHAEAFLRRLRGKKLAMTGADPADPTFRSRSRALLSDTFQLSLDALRGEGAAEGEHWLAGFSALGYAPTTGFGESLGAAIAGLSADTFEDMTLAAMRLSLLDRVLRGAAGAYRLHPLLADLVRPRVDKDAAFSRMTDWFVARLPGGGEDQGRRGREIGSEITALTDWLAQVPATDRVRVERAGSRYAIANGPYHAWLSFCEEALAGEVSDDNQSNFLWTLGQMAASGGLPDRAFAAAREKRDLDRKRGDEREAALAAGLVADILQARGQLDEALAMKLRPAPRRRSNGRHGQCCAREIQLRIYSATARWMGKRRSGGHHSGACGKLFDRAAHPARRCHRGYRCAVRAGTRDGWHAGRWSGRPGNSCRRVRNVKANREGAAASGSTGNNPIDAGRECGRNGTRGGNWRGFELLRVTNIAAAERDASHTSTSQSATVRSRLYRRGARRAERHARADHPARTAE